jgi:hypothetical protein
MAITFADNLKWIQPPQFNLEPRSRSGGESLDGQEQVVVSPSIRWRAEGTIRVQNTDQVLTYRAFLARARGRANTVLVPVCGRRSPGTVVGSIFDSGYGFDSGFGFSSTETPLAIVVSLALQTASTLFVTFGGSILKPGMMFSTPSYDLHIITNVLDQDVDDWEIAIEPPLRTGLSGDTPLEFDNPVCEMRLASDDSGALNLELNRFAKPTLSFVEA